MQSSRFPRSNSAFTLVEVLIAAGVALVGFLAITLLNSANLRYVKSARQSNAATLSLQERAEQLRLSDWRRLTDPTYLADTLLAAPTRSSAPLTSITEKVTVEAYPDSTVAQKLVVQRNSNGTRTTLVNGEGLAAQRLARVELLIAWNGGDGRQRTRSTTTLLSNGGISRMNLPGFGAAAGAPPSSTPAPTSTPDPTSTPSPTATPTPTPSPTATPTPTPAPTPTPSGNGNGNGRGNVGGKSGRN